jgi:integrase
MSVRKRTWFTETDVKTRATALMNAAPRVRLGHLYEDRAREELRKEPTREAWIVDYTDQQGERHIRTFDLKKDAVAYHATVKVDVGKGVHTAPSKSITVAMAAEDWLTYVTGEGRERTTLDGYRQHVKLHIVPRIGKVKLANLTTPGVEAFRDSLLADMSRPMAKKVLGSLKSLLKDAKRRGNVAQNVAADVSIGINGRSKAKLDIPTRAEIQRMVDAAPAGRGRALLLTAALTGLRASELRGLRWEDVDLARGRLSVKQRADRYGDIGRPKSASGERTLPIGDMVINTLREWKLRCPRKGGLVFPTGTGTIENHSNIAQRILDPAQIAAGIVGADGKPKYGLHSLRHFYASWCINRRQDGGLELPPKTVQARLGHASIVMTLDRYGHLFPSHDDGAELTEAERAIFAT